MSDLVTTIAKKLLMQPLVRCIDRRENQILGAPKSFRSGPDSPVRFEIVKESMARDYFDIRRMKSPMMFRAMKGVLKSMRDIKRNAEKHKIRISDQDLQDLNGYLNMLGISSVGYVKVPARWVFKDKAIMYENAIVCTMEMNRILIETAPSKAAGRAAHEIYAFEGEAMIKGAEFLRRRGYAAQAGHPLLGMALYPPLAQMAGLGQLGVSGLLVTPEHGPRVRLAAVFTDIDNLPFHKGPTGHEWVLDFCGRCLACVRKCPRKAIFSKPRVEPNGRITCVDNERCFPYFEETGGCAVCIKICPFNRTSYEKLRDIREKMLSPVDIL
jgi:NAD-dependent dihydropyrimidine dehydrogenase PreA subunit